MGFVIIIFYFSPYLLCYEYTKTIFPLVYLCHLSQQGGRDFSKYWPLGFEFEEDNNSVEWWRARLLVNGFNGA